MDKKKSLGSTPIGLKHQSTNYPFIRDIGNGSNGKRASETEDKPQRPVSPAPHGPGNGTNEQRQTEDVQKEKKSEKTIVSYYLEVNLVEQLKHLADANNTYYSTIVARAIRAWLQNHTN
ncbi:MAG: hypothetical protein R3281_07390 [Balneolaceae bacterium]|nr:hypothetical protein [Balneolaceae bacterium]